MPPDQSELHQVAVRRVYFKAPRVGAMGHGAYKVFCKYGRLWLPSTSQLFRVREKVWHPKRREGFPVLLQQDQP